MSHHFTAIDPAILTDKSLTTNERQLLLILEAKAGKSRFAKGLTQATLATRLGCSVRTVERAAAKLIAAGWLVREGIGCWRLVRPVPTPFVKLQDGLLGKLAKWKLHVLLFVVSDFHSTTEAGFAKYNLNLGKILDVCRIPGDSVTTRRHKLRELIEQLEKLGVVSISKPATRKQPAICLVNPGRLLRLSHAREANSEPDKPNTPDPSNRTGLPVKPNGPNPTNRTPIVDPVASVEDSVDPVPLPRAAAGAASSSQGDVDEIRFGSLTDDIAPLLPVEIRERWQQVESHFTTAMARPLVPSLIKGPTLAKRIARFLGRLKPDWRPCDIIDALQSADFNSLKECSWGLIFSTRDWQNRLYKQVAATYSKRKQMENYQALPEEEKVSQALQSGDLGRRRAAIARLASLPGEANTQTLIGLLADADVRHAACQSLLDRLINELISDKSKTQLRGVLVTLPASMGRDFLLTRLDKTAQSTDIAIKPEVRDIVRDLERSRAPRPRLSGIPPRRS